MRSGVLSNQLCLEKKGNDVSWLLRGIEGEKGKKKRWKGANLFDDNWRRRRSHLSSRRAPLLHSTLPGVYNRFFTRRPHSWGHPSSDILVRKGSMSTSESADGRRALGEGRSRWERRRSGLRLRRFGRFGLVACEEFVDVDKVDGAPEIRFKSRNKADNLDSVGCGIEISAWVLFSERKNSCWLTFERELGRLNRCDRLFWCTRQLLSRQGFHQGKPRSRLA